MLAGAVDDAIATTAFVAPGGFSAGFFWETKKSVRMAPAEITTKPTMANRTGKSSVVICTKPIAP